MHRAFLLFGVLIVSLVNLTYCTDLAEFSLDVKKHDALEKGKREYDRLVKLAEGQVAEASNDGTCWQRALRLFTKIGESCADITEPTKQAVSLAVTKCHLAVRPGSFPGEEACNSMDDMCLLPECEADVRQIVDGCLGKLSDSTFEVYIQFFNHIDNICYFFESTLWQRKTEETVNLLSQTAKFVVDNLDVAARKQDALLMQQRAAIVQQQQLLEGSLKLETALNEGQSSLQSAFHDMRGEVQEEHQKLQGIFRDAFQIFHRVLELQRTLRTQLHDFASILTYSSLVILTFYLTAAEATKSARLPLYLLWTAMIVGESVFYRFIAAIDDNFIFDHPISKDLIRSAIWYWRYACVIAGFTLWFRRWLSFRDPSILYLEKIREGLSESTKQLENSLLAELRRQPVGHPDATADEYKSIASNLWDVLHRRANESDSSPDPDYHQSSDSDSSSGDYTPTSENENPRGRASMPTPCTSSGEFTGVRRNPHRKARPTTFKTLNPGAILESSRDFTKMMERQLISSQRRKFLTPEQSPSSCPYQTLGRSPIASQSTTDSSDVVLYSSKCPPTRKSAMGSSRVR